MIARFVGRDDLGAPQKRRWFLYYFGRNRSEFARFSALLWLVLRDVEDAVPYNAVRLRRDKLLSKPFDTRISQIPRSITDRVLPFHSISFSLSAKPCFSQKARASVFSGATARARWS